MPRVATVLLALVASLPALGGERLAADALAPGPAFDSGQGVPDPATFFLTDHPIPAYRNVEETFPTRRVATVSRPSPLGTGAARFPLKYTAGSQTYGFADFVERDAASAIVILKHGKLVYEGYFHGADPQDLFISFSSGKSIVSTLVGLAVSEGAIGSVDDPVIRYLPEVRGSAYEHASIRNVLEMSSGTSYDEEYDSPTSDIATFATIVAQSQGGLYDFARSFKPVRPPGQQFYYASTDTEILGEVVRRTTHHSLADYMAERLWKPLGAEAPARWTLDAPGSHGREVAAGTLLMRARDYARFGALFAAGGRWNGRQIVPKAWVDVATRPQDPQVDFGKVAPGIGYGYQWWCLPGSAHRYAAEGIHGQFVLIDEPSSVVAVVLSAWPTAWEETKEHEVYDFFDAVVRRLRRP